MRQVHEVGGRVARDGVDLVAQQAGQMVTGFKPVLANTQCEALTTTMSESTGSTGMNITPKRASSGLAAQVAWGNRHCVVSK